MAAVMELITSQKDMRERAAQIKGAGQRLGLVPTMGFFHPGHLSLFKLAREHCRCLVASIFVNPLQFCAGEDFESYPRELSRDLAQAEKEGVELVFAPPKDELYQPGFDTQVRVGKLSHRLCGLRRPGHFDGMATVVAKLFNIIQPDLAVFGRKDYQQLLIIRRLVSDLDMRVEIVEADLIRDGDGLAMSSRNSYLTAKEREQAVSLYKGICLARELYEKGERSTEKIIRELRAFMERQNLVKVDYVNICDSETLDDLDEARPGSLLALAAFVGRTRLIDNYIFGEEL